MSILVVIQPLIFHSRFRPVRFPVLGTQLWRITADQPLASASKVQYDKIILDGVDMAAKAITVTLGEMSSHAERHLASGRYASMSEVMRAGLRALDREEAVLDELVRVRVAEALADPRPPMPLDKAFAQVRASIAKA